MESVRAASLGAIVAAVCSLGCPGASVSRCVNDANCGGSACVGGYCTSLDSTRSVGIGERRRVEIPDGDLGGVTLRLTADAPTRPTRVRRVLLSVEGSHLGWRELRFVLTDPQGRPTELAEASLRPLDVAGAVPGSDGNYAADLEIEGSVTDPADAWVGTWSLNAVDPRLGLAGTVENWGLTFQF